MSDLTVLTIGYPRQQTIVSRAFAFLSICLMLLTISDAFAVAPVFNSITESNDQTILIKADQGNTNLHFSNDIQPTTHEENGYGMLLLVTVILLGILASVLLWNRRLQRELQAHHEAEQALQESEVRFRRLFEKTDAISVQGYDRNRRVIYWNPASEVLYDYASDNAIGRQLEDLIIPREMREQVIASIDAWMDDGAEIPSSELTLRRADGSPVQVFSSHVTFRNQDNEPELYCIDIDLSKLKQAEEQIRTLSQAVEQSPVSVMITDTDGNIEYVNSTFERNTGYKSSEVMGKNPRILKSGSTSDDIYRELWQSISSGKAWQGELQNRQKNGEIYWEHANIAPVLDESGAICHYLAVNEDITIRKQQEKHILHQAHFDMVTNLPNRFLALDRLSQLLNEAGRSEELVAILFIDLDDFKKINDSMGHEVGDKVLMEAADRLRSVVRSGDTVGRLGGDEFIVLLSDLDDAIDARPVAENLLNRFRTPFIIDERELIITASVGIALYPDDGNSPSELLRNADSAMYHSKQQGRNTYSYFTEKMNRDVSRRLALEEQMHSALGRSEFRVLYQTQVDVSNRHIIGVEALLRWHNAELGDVSPEEFIPIAEQTGLIVPIGQFVLTEALGMAAKWQQQDEKKEEPFTIAVNLSPRQFRDPGLVSFIEGVLHQSGVLGESLELEITEGVLMSGHAYIDKALNAINDLGVTIAMDDFGTGYSSLSYLRNYPFDTLKIDRSFVCDITEDEADRELINASIAMAHGLGLKVVAEGVETEEQLAHLKEKGCDYAQGYLFSRPVSLKEIMELLGGQNG